MAKAKKSLTWRVGGLLVVCAIAWIQYQETLDSKSAPVKAGSAVSSKTSSSVRKSGDFDVLSGCKLISHRHNDGDSFHVSTSKGEFEFRLYYVDTPESAAKTYRGGDNNYKRLAQQGKAMGGLSRKQTTSIGMEAKHFVKNLLGKRSFRVFTRWEGVYGPERKYAFVMVQWNGKTRYLHEVLTEKGLVRIHTKPAALPDGTSVSSQMRHLRKLEKTAKSNHLGAWGVK